MKTEKKAGFIMAAVIGSTIIAAILIAGTIVSGRLAGRDTVKAVRNVSLLYLDELAGRREQVVASALENYISDMDVAIGMLEKSDLSSVENLQAYQARMKQLYSLEKFAFVDENGIIYTSRGTRKDIDLYNFDPATISKPEISLKNEDSDDKKVVIAMPVDRLSFVGNTLVACFMEIDMDIFLDALSLRSGNNNTTFCNIYTHGGKALTDLVLGGLSADDNLLAALEKAEFDKGYSFETVKEHFTNGEEGVVSFTYNGISETLSYVPIHGTDWMLTYLIRESVISEQMQSISDGIIRRSFIQSLITAVVLLAISSIIIIQTRKAVRLASERETSELLQQELEERIALQDELLKQEKMRTQQDNMITALASDYLSVYYIDLDSGKGICYRNRMKIADIAQGEEFDYVEAVTDYAQRFVTEEYREAFLDFVDPESLREGLKDNKVLTIRYMIRRFGEESYEMLRMAGVTHPGDTDDDTIHAVGAGFTNIDEEMRESLAKNQALSDALNAAEEASRAKTTFLSNMSHEIRTPMNAIIGLDSLALNEPDISDKTRDYLEKIGDSARHLLGLINDILDMSRIESGRMIIKNEEFSFREMIEQINIMFSGQCDDKKLDYNCELKGDFNDYYIGDQIKIKQVLINILGNAVKFTPENGRISFNIEKKASYDRKTTICFRISDTGIGISEEYLPKIFDTFSQENESSHNKYGSSGLGLAITKNIVDMMNGRIEVDSEKGKGTTFEVTLTLLDSDRTASGHSGETEDIEDKKKTDLNGLRILLAEDMVINAEIMKEVLKMNGMETDIAENGKIALEMFEAHEPGYYSAILMDMNMPEMNGLESAAAIRALERKDADKIPIIALTANAFDEDVQRSLQAGMNAHLSKPVEPERLVSTLEELI